MQARHEGAREYYARMEHSLKIAENGEIRANKGLLGTYGREVCPTSKRPPNRSKRLCPKSLSNLKGPGTGFPWKRAKGLEGRKDQEAHGREGGTFDR